MKFVKWDNGNGFTLHLTRKEIRWLERALEEAASTGEGKSPNIDIVRLEWQDK